MAELERIRDILVAMAAANPLTRDRYLEWCAERDRFESWKHEQDAERARRATRAGKKPPARAEEPPARAEVIEVERQRHAKRKGS